MFKLKKGDRLCVSDDLNISGAGTYIFRNYIYSALGGVVKIERNSDGQQRTISVVHDLSKSSCSAKLPTAGTIVTCRVISVNSLQAKCQINCVNDRLLKVPFSEAILRKEDVRAEDRDRVEMHNCYRPRDIILARVFGLSDKGYLLTTAEDALGVIVAYNENRMSLIIIIIIVRIER